MEKRVKALEITTEQYGRRINDHDDKLRNILDWKSAIEESTEVNRQMVEVGQDILKALRWVGVLARWMAKVSKWVITIGGAFAVVYSTFKWLWGKV